ncbi:P-loop containing nucleoside triphosphate hydrolase protein [Zychaea mexicana]|uniref:P-loop containing nucleoside triphosphate hydrolase protein n=1 Tax=Zychaea mexicana TaxID=64656 RepID=UPI0022FF0AC5|nr:P-loop containing nucleoside triphosphate hydrolase protein [Zychaea mexicana]KAI9498522.1 P-loop containing nucleoside triphosphate hydrolase protein [Zychaea mexicana]
MNTVCAIGSLIYSITQIFDLAFESDRDPWAPRSILVTGDSGVGKTTVLNMLAAEHRLKTWRISLGELAAQYDGKLGIGLERVAWQAREESKGIIWIEDIDLFCPQRGEAQDTGFLQSLHRIVHELEGVPHVVLVATSRDPSTIALDARSLFDDMVTLQIPTPSERLALLRCLVKPLDLASNVNLELLNAQAHAFVAADMARWCHLALETARYGQITLADFEQAIKRIRVSGIQMAEKPEPVQWDDIGGLEETKKALEESILWVYKHSDAYKRLGVRPPRGVLLYGPPGTGKTMLAKAIATESSANFLPVSIPDLIKGEVGESEKAIANVFKVAARCSPCVIFLDELEAIFGTRETSGDVGKKLISQFLIEIDHVGKADQGVLLLGATNHPDAIDPAILRPGRLDRMIYVGFPNMQERIGILKVLERNTVVSGSVDLTWIAENTEGYSGADLKAVMRKAGLLALKKSLSLSSQSDESVTIGQQDIQNAIHAVTPSSYSSSASTSP